MNQTEICLNEKRTRNFIKKGTLKPVNGGQKLLSQYNMDL